MTKRKLTIVDVLIIGGGGSGLSAAAECATAGMTVLLVEKCERVGGSTGKSVGSITATGTRLQRRAGIIDSSDAHYEDIALFAEELISRDNVKLRRMLVDNAGESVRWLESLGVVFYGPMPEPPHRVRRMHNVIPSSKSYIDHLTKRCARLGVKIYTSTNAVELLSEEREVVGATLERAGGERFNVRARRGVILACGDISSSRELKARYVSPDLAAVPGVNPASTGDGVKLGESVGGIVVNGDVMYGPELRFIASSKPSIITLIPTWRWVAIIIKAAMDYAPARLLRPFLMKFATTNLAPNHFLFEKGAILINKKGARFTEETEKPELDVAKQDDGVSYIVLDANIASTFNKWPNYISTVPGLAYAYLQDYAQNRQDIVKKGKTVKELAKKLRANEQALQQSVKHAEEKGNKPWTGPYYALGPLKSWVVIADGGLKVSEKLEVLTTDNEAIKGLYAAGSTGQGGVLLFGHGHHIGWAVTSGRMAAQSIKIDR